MDEDTPYMKSNYADYKKLSEDDKNKVDNAVNYFKELKDNVHLQSDPTTSS